jgi:hypothetical protein
LARKLDACAVQKTNPPVRPNLSTNKPLRGAVSAHDAAQNAPTLAHLAKLGRESSDRLKAIEPLIPEALRSSVKAGPIDEKNWCLLVNSNAAAAKIRQLLPLLEGRLLADGWKVNSIRLKILITKPY